MARETRGTSVVRELPTLLPTLLAVGVLLVLAIADDGAAGDLLLAFLTLLGTQVLPGVLVWRAVRPRDGWLVEDLALGLCCGAALAVPAQLLALVTGLAAAAAAAPLLVAGALLAVPGTRARVRAARWAPLPAWWGTLAVVPAVAAVWVSVPVLRSTSVSWDGWGASYVDQPYHLALVGEVTHRWPPHYPQVAGEPLEYHWFAHAWMAQLGTVSGASLDQVLLRFAPVLLTVALPLVVAVVAVRLSGLAVAGPLAAGFAFVAHSLDLGAFPEAWTPFALHSPTQSFGSLVLAALLALLVLRWRGEAPRGSLFVLLLLLVVGGGAKGTVLPVLLAGCLVATVVVAVVDRSRLRTVALDTVLTGAVLLVLMRLVFGGGEGGMVLTPFTSLARVNATRFGLGDDLTLGTGLAITALSLLVAVVPVVALFALLGDRATRTDPGPWLLLGTAVAAYGAFVAFRHYGLSQLYFVMTAEVAVAVGAGWGLARLWQRAGWRLLAGAAVLGAAVALAVRLAGGDGAAGSLTGSWVQLLVFLAVVGLVAAVLLRGRGAALAAAVAATACAAGALSVDPYGRSTPSEATARTPSAFASDQVEAARYVRDHSDPDELVMSNRHCRSPRRQATCDARRFFVAAYTERSVLLEGWAYTMRANTSVESPDENPRTVPFWDPELLELNDGFYTDPTRQAAEELYERGVRWVFVDHTAPYDEAIGDHAVERFRSANATVYELSGG
ncbi:hypothetical protein [Nocardioides caldifontis]|uniref:hypothetical protein n=1 Tax=Nocardioides caldifontis TaxID=2588938 RepID=UPI0011DFDE08|nr:hypothetical protein [Nocardioides caldifontis]